MRILGKTARFAAVALAVLFIGLSLGGIVGVWFVDRKAADIALKAFGLIGSGVGIVDAGVGRVDNLITTSRTEIRQASETITAVGTQTQANSPVLNALNDRLETNLGPRIAQMQQALAPVRDAVSNIASAVSLINSLPMMADRAPRLTALDETFERLQGLAADATQMRGTIQGLAAAQNNNVTPQAVATLNGLAQRIDTRLGEVQANVQGIRSSIDALRVRLDARKSRMLFVFNLLALLSTLMLAWIIYSQVVVVRHHWNRMRRPAANGTQELRVES